MRISTLLIVALLGLVACQASEPEKRGRQQAHVGQTMGTTYSIKYYEPNGLNHQVAIDSLLVALNDEVSTYIPNSTISQFNQSEKGISLSYNPKGEGAYENLHFLQNLSFALRTSKATDGALQPTIMPIVNYWGFGYTPKRAVTQADSVRIDSLMEYVGLDKIRIGEDSILKDKKGTQLDFSSLAKGYGVDLVGDWLASFGVKDYYVEIGGEVSARGKSPRGDYWRIGISVPKEDSPIGEFAATVPLANQAIATSGNYRNYYDVEGEKYGHTMNPKTGFPEKNNLLSASVFAPNCMSADAYATAFMVMGVEKALSVAETIKDIEAYFIIGKEDGSMETVFTTGLAPIFGGQ